MIDSSEGDARGRVSTRMSGAITVGRRRSTVAVRNISTGGAMIELPSPPEEGTRIRFETETTGKLDARVGRKMGHLNITAPTPGQAKATALQACALLGLPTF